MYQCLLSLPIAPLHPDIHCLHPQLVLKHMAASDYSLQIIGNSVSKSSHRTLLRHQQRHDRAAESVQYNGIAASALGAEPQLPPESVRLAWPLPW